MDYLPGSVKRHPQWPHTAIVAMRTIYEDDSPTACTSWQSLTPGHGSYFLTAADVATWPDVEELLLTVEPPAD